MLIALGESLHEKGHIDKENELKHYRMWLNEGKYTPKGKAVGTGKTTEFAIKNGYPKSDRMSNGNGALMRSSIITPYYLNLSDMRLAEASGDSAKVTHGHAVSVFTNIIFSLVLKKVILGQTVNAAMSNVSQKYRGLIEDVDIIFDKPERYITTPYCVTSLQTSLNIVSDSDSFEEAILKAVNLGGDADTIGAITGAIAGARFGIKDIPERFLKFALSEKILRYEGIKKFF
jgi:ADP-ribosyl-[dinitrogen reductase] hydrolase